MVAVRSARKTLTPFNCEHNNEPQNCSEKMPTDPPAPSGEQHREQIVAPSPPVLQGIQPPTGLPPIGKEQGCELENLQAAMGELQHCSTARKATRRVQSGTIPLLDRTRCGQDNTIALI